MSVDKTSVTQLQVEIPDPDPVEGFEPWIDRVRMIWYPHVDPPTAVGGWWELTGQNMGPGILIVHPYQIEALIELLQAAREARP